MKRKNTHPRNDARAFWQALKQAQKLKAKGKRVEVIYTAENGWQACVVKLKEGQV